MLCILAAISNYKIAVRIIACIVLFALALVSKLSSASLLLLLPLTVYYYNSVVDYKKPLLFFVSLLLTLAAFYIFSTTVFSSERALNFSENPLVKSAFDEKIATSLVVLLHYIKMMLLPTTHSFYYGFNMVPVVKFSNPLAILSFIIHCYILYWAIKNLPKKHPVAFAILFYLLAIFPFSNIAYPVPGIIGERFAYVATVGFSIAFAWVCIVFASKILKSTKVLHYVVLPGLFLLYYSYDIVDRNKDWKDTNTLYEADIDHLAKSSHANYLYAKSLQVKADTTYTANRTDIYNKALKYYNNVKKDYWQSQWYMAKIYFVLGNNPKSLQHIDAAYKLSPENKKEDLLIDIINIQEANGKFNENIDILTKYAAKTPQSALYNYYLMRNHIFANSDTALVGQYARAVITIDKDGYYANKTRGFMAIMKNDIVNNIKYSEMAFEQNPLDLELANYLYGYYKNKDAVKEQYYLTVLQKQKPKASL
ncbi:MAG: hypothetical protein M0D57_06415 [Sphingobacteriales bacterium JAD_PAG50586_3]|nr:MAG: hypothetical protein M0D57_06415 [Sphingobacteriales bacterium JAD_PAG50586_3]